MRDIVLNNEYIRGPQLWVNSRLLTGVHPELFLAGKVAERRDARTGTEELKKQMLAEKASVLPGEGGPPGTRKDGRTQWTQWTQVDVDVRTGALKAATPH